ncbi:WecB/TagA/CpsF family glycosyltransferase [Paraburkholderia lacunae]|uniref:Glycosyltransferase n=1 Tax=Paraburkholderia lacunae TaxID=2211104 RepID=A0A370N1V8_9BURK|nr:WecB/TagA/CpsF family glycosyltransferase [Paraburkholderia lacunae]RDJ99494.1 glycosyltransferase [Paraburkholderia lacunae]
MKRIELLGCPLDIATLAETVGKLSVRIANRQFTQHVVVNVAKLVNFQTDVALAQSVRECDVINVDGMGVVWGARLLGYDVAERVAGIDLFQALLQVSASHGYPVFFLGATDEVVRHAVERCVACFHGLRIAGYHHGYFGDDEQAVVDMIRQSGARLLFVAMSSPKKENFINRWKSALHVDFVMGVGGSFDVMAGKVKRAPLWMQRCGLEWFYRVIQEPRRMWKRYLVTNCKFVWMLGMACITPRRH